RSEDPLLRERDCARIPARVRALHEQTGQLSREFIRSGHAFIDMERALRFQSGAHVFRKLADPEQLVAKRRHGLSSGQVLLPNQSGILARLNPEPHLMKFTSDATSKSTPIPRARPTVLMVTPARLQRSRRKPRARSMSGWWG